LNKKYSLLATNLQNKYKTGKFT